MRALPVVIPLWLTLMSSGCAIVSSVGIGNKEDERGGAAGIPYMLPKALLPLELVVSGAAIRIDVLEPVFVGDTEHVYLLRHNANPFSSDEIKLEVDPATSLLRGLTLESKDETGEVLKKLIASTLRAESATGAGEAVILQTLVDPDDDTSIAATSAALNGAINSYLGQQARACQAAPPLPAEPLPGCAQFASLPNGGAPAAKVTVRLLASDAAKARLTDTKPDTAAGIYHRASLPYRVDLSLFGQSRSTVVLLPNKGPILSLPLKGQAFVTVKHTVVLRNGVVEKYESNKPSSALAIVSWPLDVYEAVVSTTAKIIQLKIDTSRNSLALQQQVVDEAEKRKALEDKLKDIQSPKAESARLIGMGSANKLLTVGTGIPPSALPPAAKDGALGQNPKPATGAPPPAATGVLHGNDGKPAKSS